MGRITVFLILVGLFISVYASKVGGSYGHVRHREIYVPLYATNIKPSIRTGQQSSIDEGANDALADDNQPTDNLPAENALADENQSNVGKNEDANNTLNGSWQKYSNENSQSANQDIAHNPDKLDNPSNENNENGKKLIVRGITAGDTFTTHELLPVTRKLIEKVENPGEGKGIVSSSKSPEALADVLFESFFFGSSRIVTLEDNDIVGLDALQALALSGDEARRTQTKVTAPAPGYSLFIEDQVVKVNPRTSKYLLLRKAGSYKIPRRNKNKTYRFVNRKDKRKIKRRAPYTSRQGLINKLQKKRRLVLNPIRKNNKINKTGIIKNPALSKKTAVYPERQNIKHNKTKAIKSSASTKKGVKPKVKPARKNIEINKAKDTKTDASAKVTKGAKSVKETKNHKIAQKNQRSQKLLSAKKRTVATNMPGKANKGNKKINVNKNLNKYEMLNRIKGNPATPRPIRTTTVHRTSPLCRWRYECTEPANLDTCKLHTQCNLGNLKATTNADFIGPVRADEEIRNLRKFHKMIGISPVDEEVEKILEARIINLRPPVTIEKPSRIETLSQYFNNIIVNQLRSSTKAENSDNYDETTMANLVDQDVKNSKDNVLDGPNNDDKKITLEDVVDSNSRRQRSNTGVPHTGRPFLQMMY